MIRKRQPDVFKATSLIAAAEKEMQFIMKLEIVQESASTIVSRVYESFRMMGDALLSLHGKQATGPDHHTQMINELFKLSLKTQRPIQALGNLKTLRNKINYQGYIATVEDAKDAHLFALACFSQVVIQIKKELQDISKSG